MTIKPLTTAVTQRPSEASSPEAPAAAAPVAPPVVADGFETRRSPGRGWPTSAPIFPEPSTRPSRSTVPDDAPVVVVYDGGVDFKHPDLDGSMWTNPNETAGDGIDNDGNGIIDDIHGANIVRMDGDPSRGEETAHGTHVAGIIGAEDDGVGNTGAAAGKAKIMAVAGSFTPRTELEAFEKGVDYVVKMKTEHGVNIRVLNGSFGDVYRDPAVQARFTAAVQKLADADILFVVAAGNDGADADRTPFFPGNVELPNVITVASMDSRNDKLAGFSNFGDEKVELAGKGSNVLSTVPGGGYQRMSGTSMAAPEVAGAAARVFAKHPHLNAEQVRQMMLDAVEKDPDLTGKVSTGGKLNIEKLDAALPPVPPPAPPEQPEVLDWR
ncbi:MAG: S8 family serine peptidase [Myxococcota bacterium]|nr:S8 family serine peptidase [Myxococcota bacterium]